MADLDRIARRRKTLKLLGDPAAPLPARGIDRATVESLVDAAGWAPFHRPSHRAREEGDAVCEPWRFTLLDAAACRALLARLDGFSDPPGKVADMLAVADALILATWLPEPAAGQRWEATDFNMEHIAAAAAAVQTLLLAATERGINTYWSSGGVLGREDAFSVLGIDKTEVLIGAVFLFPDPPAGTDPQPGKLRARRSGRKAWARWVTPE